MPYALHDLHIYRCSKVGLEDNLQYYNSLQLIYSYTQASLNFFKLLQISSKFFKLPLTTSCCCKVCFEFCFLVANVDHSKLQIISSTKRSSCSRGWFVTSCKAELLQPREHEDGPGMNRIKLEQKSKI